MQPVLTQVPPTSCRSISATLWPARSAARERRPGLACPDDDRIELLCHEGGSDDDG